VFELEPYDAIADSVVPEPSVRCNEEAAYTWLGVVLHQGLSWVSQSEDHVSIIRAKILKVINKIKKGSTSYAVRSIGLPPSQSSIGLHKNC
jgi:hypothetical protein